MRSASPSKAIGTVLSCAAGTTAISTALDVTEALTVRVPPVWTVARQGAAKGATTSAPVCGGHAVVGLPRIDSTLRPMKFASGTTMITAAFFAATISAVVEFGAADTTCGLSQVPASSAFIFMSPMWSP